MLELCNEGPLTWEG